MLGEVVDFGSGVISGLAGAPASQPSLMLSPRAGAGAATTTARSTSRQSRPWTTCARCNASSPWPWSCTPPLTSVTVLSALPAIFVFSVVVEGTLVSGVATHVAFGEKSDGGVTGYASLDVSVSAGGRCLGVSCWSQYRSPMTAWPLADLAPRKFAILAFMFANLSRTGRNRSFLKAALVRPKANR